MSDQIDIEELLPIKPSRGSAQTGRRAGRVRDRKDDLHETFEPAVRALMKVERLPHQIWEPCCGKGAIVRPLRDAGHVVYATDLVRYHDIAHEAGVDFLLETAKRPMHGIVTNPPYKNADAFVHKAIELCPYVAMLLRLGFLEGGARSEKRAEVLDGGKLARVYIFANRLPRMHREGWQGKRAGPTTVYAWMIWDANHRGPWTGHRIRWE